MTGPDALGLANRTVERIRFEECVDAGGFGIVYRGRVDGREEPVAIKCLRLTRLANLTDAARTSIVRRFGEETKILQHLSRGTHDIVGCLGSGQLFAPTTGEPVPYIVLEWLDGRTLAADLAERRARGAPGRSLRETLDLMESAALALAHAHSQGIVHLDVKPANLMLTRLPQRADGSPGGSRLKVLDFGLAQILSGEAGAGKNLATADGVQLFSVAYCAPEQLSSEVGEIGAWSDLYALVLVMLEVMRGERVRPSMTSALRASSVGLTLPAPVEDLLARALAPDPRDRPANAGAFWAELRELTKQSVPPVVDASTLAATAYDGEVAAAMLKVRARAAAAANAGAANASAANASAANASAANASAANASAANASAANASAANASAANGSSLTSTIVMANAPGHRPRPPPAPRAAPAASPAPPAAASPVPADVAPPTSPHAVTVGSAVPSPLATSLGAPSPLAASLAVGVPSPLAQASPAAGALAPPSATNDAAAGRSPPPPTSPSAAANAPAPAPAPGAPKPPSVPPSLARPQPSGPGLVIVLLALLVLAVALVAAWMLLRPR